MNGIKERRIACRLTQIQLAKIIGIKQPSLCAIENGDKKPSLETAIKLAKALGCTLDDLVSEKEAEVPNANTEPKETKKATISFSSQLREAEMEREQLEYQFEQYQLDGNERLADAAYGKLKEAESKVNRLRAERK